MEYCSIEYKLFIHASHLQHACVFKSVNDCRSVSERVRIHEWVFCMHVWILLFISVFKATVDWSRKSTLWLQGALHFTEH